MYKTVVTVRGGLIMNRQILFKTKRKDWEELPKDQWWVVGDLLHMRYGDIVLISNFEDQLFRCDGNTVCQFTGLHDNTKWGDLTEAEKESFLSDWNYREDRKNKIEDWSGRKIWENDILRYSYDYDGSPFLKDGEEIKYRVGAVFWSEWRGSWAVCGRGNKKYTNNDVFKYNRNPNRAEVIGNIFDNPELLEVE